MMTGREDDKESEAIMMPRRKCHRHRKDLSLLQTYRYAMEQLASFALEHTGFLPPPRCGFQDHTRLLRQMWAQFFLQR